MRRLKIVVGLWMTGACLFLGAASSQAASEADVTVTVTISGSLSVSVSPSSYAFGTLGVSVGSVSGTSISVTNNSTAFRETYSLSASNTNDSWTLASSNGNNQFVLAAVFSSAAPGGTFNDANHRLTTSSVACTGSVFAGTAAYNCQQVSTSIALGLWFEMLTPTQITGSAGPETSTVAITAAAG